MPKFASPTRSTLKTLIPFAVLAKGRCLISVVKKLQQIHQLRLHRLLRRKLRTLILCFESIKDVFMSSLVSSRFDTCGVLTHVGDSFSRLPCEV